MCTLADSRVSCGVGAAAIRPSGPIESLSCCLPVCHYAISKFKPVSLKRLRKEKEGFGIKHSQGLFFIPTQIVFILNHISHFFPRLSRVLKVLPEAQNRASLRKTQTWVSSPGTQDVEETSVLCSFLAASMLRPLHQQAYTEATWLTDQLSHSVPRCRSHQVQPQCTTSVSPFLSSSF